MGQCGNSGLKKHCSVKTGFYSTHNHFGLISPSLEVIFFISEMEVKSYNREPFMFVLCS